MKRKAFKIGVRIAISAVFLGLVVWAIDLKAVRKNLAEGVDWPLACAFGLLLVVAILEMGLRWALLLRAAGIPATFRGALAVAYTGAFFNQFSLGAAGGDIARAVLVARDTDMKARAVGTILLDRVIGLVTLILMGFVVAVTHAGEKMYFPFVLALGCILVGLAGGALIYFNEGLRRSALGEWLKRKVPGSGVLRDMDSVFKGMRHRPGLLMLCVVISAVGQATSMVATWGLARSLHLEQVTLSQCFSVLPLVSVVMALPIAIGGFGTGEFAFITSFVHMGVAQDQAATLIVLFRAAYFVTALPGVVIFLLGKARMRKG